MASPLNTGRNYLRYGLRSEGWEFRARNLRAFLRLREPEEWGQTASGGRPKAAVPTRSENGSGNVESGQAESQGPRAKS